MSCEKTTATDMRALVSSRYKDIVRIVSAIVRDPATRAYIRQAAAAGRRGRHLLEAEDLAHEVCALMLRRDGTASAYDPARASLSRYTHLTTWHLLTHGTEARDTEAPLDDPAAWSRLAAPEGESLPPALAAILADAANEAQLRALARHLRADAKRGQVRLFDPLDELVLRGPLPTAA